MRPHKVRKVKVAVGLSDEQRTSLVEMRNALSGIITVGQQSAAVRITLQRIPVQKSVQLARIHRESSQLSELTEQIHPGIQIRGSVVRVRHRNRIAGRCRHHIDLTINLLQRLLADQHREGTRSGTDISGPRRYGIRRDHTGARIAFRRSHRNTALQ